jgi:plastocyanin
MATTLERPEPTRTQPPTRTGDRFVAVAAASLAVVLLVIQGLAGHVIPPLAIFAALYLGLGIAIGVRRSRWLLGAIIVLSLVYLVGSIPFFVVNLAHPESPASFLSEAFVVVALLSTVIGAIAGWRGARPGSRRPVAIGAAAAVGLAVVVTLVASSGVESDVAQPADVPVESVRSTFPERLEVPAGEAVLWVDNQDPFHHTLVIEGTDVHVALPGSTAVRVPVDLSPGTYRYFCDVPGHERMEGEIVVG